MNNLKFGQIITVKSKLVRIWLRGNKKEWAGEAIKQVDAIFLGMRTLSDGENYYNDDYLEYHPNRHFRAALVAIPNRNPFYTLVESKDA